MNEIFRHTDCDGDSVRLVGDVGDSQEDLAILFFDRNDMRVGGVRLDIAAKIALANALDEHLHQDDRAEPEPVYEALVRRLVAEEVARVLPLHQSPQAAYVPEPDAEEGWVSHEHATNTGVRLCTDTRCPWRGFHADHDPEPQAVGHPEAPSPEGPCQDPLLSGHRLIEVHAECGYVWAMHRVPGSPAVDWSDKLFGKAEYPPGLKFDYCTGCGHSWGNHGDWGTGKNQCDSQLGKSVCECTRKRGAVE